MDRHASILFSPYKSIGLVCSSIAPVFRALPKRRIVSVLTAVDNVVHQYNSTNLRLISISDALPAVISLLAADQMYVYAVVGNRIAALHLSRQVKFWIDVESPICAIYPFGAHLLAIDIDARITVWDIESQTKYTEIWLGSTFRTTAICHPSTYMNKIVFGSDTGAMKLINVKTGQLIYDFKGFDASISVLVQSPAVDVLGIGLHNGRILLHNIRNDVTLFGFKQDWPVTGLAFRSDGIESMITSGTEGDLIVWDLSKQRLIGTMQQSHRGIITGIGCIAGEPLLISAGDDNSLRTWIFDRPDGLGRQLVLRDGHSMPATTVQFHGEWLLSASADGTVRAFSVTKDTKQQNFGTAGTMTRAKAKTIHCDLDSIRLPPVIAMATGMSRESVWDNVLCVHANSPIVTSWTTRRQSLGSHRLIHHRFETRPELASAYATAITITACGNFALIGMSTGHLDCFNIQSGRHRGMFNDSTLRRAHASAIGAVCSDGLNQLVISACNRGRIKFWRLKNKSLINSLDVGRPITQMCLNRSNSLAAVALANGAVGVVDIQLQRVVRRFNDAHTGCAVTAITFSFDGQWLISTDDAGYLKVWQLSTAHLIDVMHFSSVCIAISFSATGDYLATCHRDRRCVYLWANTMMHQSNIVLRPLAADYRPKTSEMLTMTTIIDDGECDDQIEIDNDEPSMSIAQQLSADLVTLSGLAEPRWASLYDLDRIRLRNKPKAPPTKPKSAPFFLPTISTLDGFTFASADGDDGSATADRGRVLKAKRRELELETTFGRRLRSSENADDRRQAFDLLKSMGPAQIDVELRSLAEDTILPFLTCISEMLRARVDFELVNAYLATFLKIHREQIWSRVDDDAIDRVLRDIADHQRSAWSSVDELMTDSVSVIDWIKSAII